MVVFKYQMVILVPFQLPAIDLLAGVLALPQGAKLRGVLVQFYWDSQKGWRKSVQAVAVPVSYTHLTLPTIA